MYNKKIWSWALYDWANSAFATVVMAGFFPIVFKKHWASELELANSTFYLGLSNSISSIIIVMIAPLVGAIADLGCRRKRFLLVFAAIGMIATICLSFVQAGQWPMAMMFYILAMVGFMAGNVFYDSLLLSVSPQTDYDGVSALGYALGYVGGGVILALCVLMTLQPNWFGFNDAISAAVASFFLAGCWWCIFSLPLLSFVHDAPNESVKLHAPFKQSIRRLIQTASQLKSNKNIVLFLLAYWFYIDGVDTIIVMAVDYGLTLGFNSNNLITALLLTQLIGFPATLGFGRIAKFLGAKTGIYICLLAYMLITVWGYSMNEVWEFYCIAALVGLFQGGVQALSRSYYAKMIPPAEASEYFGFYNMLGKFAAVLGPLLMGIVSVLSGSSRLSILSIIVFFIIGMFLLSRVDEKNFAAG